MWPQRGRKVQREGVVLYQPLPGKQRRYVFMRERTGKAARPKKTNWKHLRRRQYEVVSSTRVKAHHWTDTELEAAQLVVTLARLQERGELEVA